MQGIQEKSLVDILRDLWSARKWLLSFAFIGAVLGGVWMMMATPHYKAQIIVAPANPMNGAEISSLLANDNLFALRYLVQRVGISNTSDFLRFENIYKGPSVAAELLRDEKIVAGLRNDQDFVFSNDRNGFVPETLAEYLKKQVSLQPVGGSNLRRLVYFHPDREFARYFLNRVHAVTDNMIRESIREEADSRIAYLKQAVRQSRNPEHSRALTTLLLEQERLRMVVSIDQAYTASVIEPASSTVEPARPDAYLVFSLFALAGGLFGLLVFSMRQTPSTKLRQRDSRRWFKQENENGNQKKRALTSDAAE